MYVNTHITFTHVAYPVMACTLSGREVQFIHAVRIDHGDREGKLCGGRDGGRGRVRTQYNICIMIFIGYIEEEFVPIKRGVVYIRSRENRYTWVERSETRWARRPPPISMSQRRVRVSERTNARETVGERRARTSVIGGAVRCRRERVPHTRTHARKKSTHTGERPRVPDRGGGTHGSSGRSGRRVGGGRGKKSVVMRAYSGRRAVDAAAARRPIDRNR